MSENPNRTLVCSVLFLDIEDHSKKSVTEQLNLKRRFNAILSAALSHVGTDDRIVLDTGDGAAVCFLSDPEDSLFAAINVRDAIASTDPVQTTQMRLRIGINLGPVRLLKDINGQVNIIGDGINDAQRVMSFTEPGKILVSRSYFEIVSRLSDDYSRLFVHEGVRTDKHVREHEVYAVGIGTPGPAKGRVASPVDVQPSLGDSATSKQIPTETIDATSDRNTPKRGVQRWMAVVLVATIVVVGAGSVWFWHGTTSKELANQPAPNKPTAAGPAHKTEKAAAIDGRKEVGPTPGWLIRLRKELASCNQQGFFQGVVCADQARRKYCEPSHWGEVEECLVRRTDPQ